MLRGISIRFSRICLKEIIYNNHPSQEHKQIPRHRTFGELKYGLLSQKYKLRPKNLLKHFKR
jgi:hypothetical protein